MNEEKKPEAPNDQGSASSLCSPVRLFEFQALVKYDVVVAATSEEDARDAISSWENAWPHNSEFSGVCDVDLTDERELGDQTKQWAKDEANEISMKAYKQLRDDD